MSGQDRQRLDLWLHRARLFKTRAAAAEAIAAGAVRVSRAERSRSAAKPSETVKIGDGLCVAGPRGLIVLEVLGLPARRGPPAEARGHYRLLDDDEADLAADGVDGDRRPGHLACGHDPDEDEPPP